MSDPLDELDPYLLESVRITPEAIDEDFIRVPGHLAYWNKRFADASDAHARAKHQLDLMRAHLTPVIRQALADAGGRATEAQVDAGIESHAEYVEARAHVNRTETDKMAAYGNVDAVRAKRDMLISLGAHLRAEMEHDPHIRERSRAKRVMAGDS